MRGDDDRIGMLRVPPHSMDAEHAVLGGLLLDNGAWDRMGDLLTEAHFYRFEHRLIYSAIGGLVNASKPADVVTVFERLESMGRAEDIGGLAYLNQLAQSVPSARNARHYAEIVLKHAMRRRVISLADELATGAFAHAAEGADIAKLVDEHVARLLEAVAIGHTAEPADIGDVLAPWIDRLTELAESEGDPNALPTGLEDLDDMLDGGARPGELIVCGARPSMGKSSWSLQVARNWAKRTRVLFCTLEDSVSALVSRQVAAVGGVNLAHLRRPHRMPDRDWAKVTDGIDELKGLHLSLDEQAAASVADIRRKAMQVKRRHGKIGAVVVDYIQLMEGEGDNRNITLGVIANALKRLAKDLGIPILLLSQLSRKADDRPGGPEMSDLRDSGDIEGAADVIWLLHRESRRKATEENTHHAEIRQVKNKSGRCGTVNAFFDGALQRWGNWEGPPPKRGK